MIQPLSFLKKLKGLEWRNSLYPFISGIFLLLIIGLSFFVLQSLSKNLNKAFSVDEAAVQMQLVRVDRDNLLIAAKKFGVELVLEQPASPAKPATTSSDVGGEGVTPQPAEEDKTLLKIQVLNSTKTTGLARDLKGKLQQAGFLVKNIGDFSQIQESTQVKIKGEKAASFLVSIEELKQIVSQNYTLGEEPENLEADNLYDVVIIIGTQ